VDETNGAPRLAREFHLSSYAATIEFVDLVAALAEQQDHHPSMLVEWGRVTVAWWTHAIQNLSRNDYIMAARTDELYDDFRSPVREPRGVARGRAAGDHPA
jgi:4a-hydroxytetrahydrobiopterin dehydratase